MKHTLLTLFFTSLILTSKAQEQFTQLYGTYGVEDKISLIDNRLGNTNMYGFGVESNTMYYKTAGIHRWYVAKNADGGTSSKMELDASSLTLKTILRSTDKISLVSNLGSLGDIISLYGDRLGNTNMYGFGIETNGGVLYNKAASGYNWYINTNADQGTSAIMMLNSSELVVDGKIRSEEVKVEIINGPDYVFEPDYELRTLEETKEFITENKHLPEIPSAKEMEANGVDLGDMNMRLLKKIEELTLYQIQLMEEMEGMKKELQELKK
ncbi:myosin/kinesin family protein [Marinoscillum luteum]|uniref:Uncharacterized protein n=1 Tax=Marinoscillum luteum TaxID=861051 RepID=A0ABW7N7S6_9BACT